MKVTEKKCVILIAIIGWLSSKQVAAEAQQDPPPPNDPELELQDLFLALFFQPGNEETPTNAQAALAVEKCAAQSQLPSDEDLQMISKLCPKKAFFYGFNTQHMTAVHALQNILKGQNTAKDVICLARALRDRPEINRHVWLRAVTATAISRPDMETLPRPNLIEIMPSMFIQDEAIKRAKRLAPTRQCYKVDGSIGADNGFENKLWYWREDIALNSHHLYWHLSNPFSFRRMQVPVKQRPDRRGELFVYLHHGTLARYHVERLTNRMGPTPPLRLTPGLTLPGHFYGHLTDANSNQTWTERPPNLRIQNLVSNRDFIAHPSNISVSERMELQTRIERDIQTGSLIQKDGRPVPLDGFRGIDILAEVVEAGIWSINPDRYGEFGIHNDGHFLIGLIADPQDQRQIPPGLMADPAVNLRDPIFYLYHESIDNIFDLHKKLLKPYNPVGGEFQLTWPGVELTGIQVKTRDGPSQPNVLTTFWNQKNLNLVRGLDFNRSDAAGPVSVCVKHLDHKPFTYQFTINRKSNQQKASVRIFLAPRVDQNGKRYRFQDQRKLFFVLDYFQVDLNPGPNLITRQSTDSTLTISLPQGLQEQERDQARRTIYCGCGWPHHMLLPKGTEQGYAFDLFAMLTSGDEDRVSGGRTLYNNPSGSFGGGSRSNQCNPAPLYCGIDGERYPDSKPMGYPFDRLPYSIRDNSGRTRVVETLEEYVSQVPNMAATQVTIIHSRGSEGQGPVQRPPFSVPGPKPPSSPNGFQPFSPPTFRPFSTNSFRPISATGFRPAGALAVAGTNLFPGKPSFTRRPAWPSRG